MTHVLYLGKDAKELYDKLDVVFENENSRVLIATQKEGTLVGRLINFNPTEGFNLSDVVLVAPDNPPEVISWVRIKPEIIRESYLLS